MFGLNDLFDYWCEYDHFVLEGKKITIYLRGGEIMGREIIIDLESNNLYYQQCEYLDGFQGLSFDYGWVLVDKKHNINFGYVNEHIGSPSYYFYQSESNGFQHNSIKAKIES